MDLDDLEVLSSTDLECYWRKVKAESKEFYTPMPIANYKCLESTIKRRKPVRALTGEELKDCLLSGLNAAPESSLNKHRLGRHEILSTRPETPPSPLNNNNNNCDFLVHCENSKFCRDLSVTVSRSAYNLKECCATKFRQIEEIDTIEALKIQQGSQKWLLYRKFRLTGTTCYPIFTYNIGRSDEEWRKKAERCWFSEPITNNSNMNYGKAEEKNAVQAYKESTKSEVVTNLGIIISKYFPWFGFSPDGVILDQGVPVKLLEIKCPVSGKTADAQSFENSCSYLKYSKTEGRYYLKEKHTYFAQIQLGLALLNLKSCDFILYSSFSKTYLKYEIEFNPSFTKKMIESTTEKYFCKMLPFVCDKN